MQTFSWVQISVFLSLCSGQRDLPCDQGETCVRRDSCALYNSELGMPYKRKIDICHNLKIKNEN